MSGLLAAATPQSPQRSSEKTFDAAEGDDGKSREEEVQLVSTSIDIPINRTAMIAPNIGEFWGIDTESTAGEGAAAAATMVAKVVTVPDETAVVPSSFASTPRERSIHTAYMPFLVAYNQTCFLY